MPLLAVKDVKKYFPVERGLTRSVKGLVRAVDGISFELEAEKILGVVGESGCGKTTLARLILGLLKPTEGRILFEGADIAALSKGQMRTLRRRMQIIFQDPYNSLNPRMRIGEILTEPFLVHNIGTRFERVNRAKDLLFQVGLKPEYLERYPHQFSGGERQRIGIARSLATEPKIIICDEPVSSLDLSIQAQILKLLKDIQERRGLSYMFISHDLRVIESLCDSVIVMYLGKVFEHASTRELYSHPIHPYTETLFSAISTGPQISRKRAIAKGEPPSAITPPSGCKFHPRCPYAEPRCKIEEPRLEEVKPGHFVACPPRIYVK